MEEIKTPRLAGSYAGTVNVYVIHGGVYGAGDRSRQGVEKRQTDRGERERERERERGPKGSKLAG